MAKKSAGIILYRQQPSLQVLLVHPGGPFWAKKDVGAWTIPKGEVEEGEDFLTTAIREVQEEIGLPVNGPFMELQPIKQKSGKWVYAWATEADFDTTLLVSNSFEMEWPPRSGQQKSFPEVDRAEWFSVQEAIEKIIPAQIPFVMELEKTIAAL